MEFESSSPSKIILNIYILDSRYSMQLQHCGHASHNVAQCAVLLYYFIVAKNMTNIKILIMTILEKAFQVGAKRHCKVNYHLKGRHCPIMRPWPTATGVALAWMQ